MKRGKRPRLAIAPAAESKTEAAPAPQPGAKVDVHARASTRGGAAGFWESQLRKFRAWAHVAMFVPLLLAGGICFGLAVFPAVALFRALGGWAQGQGFAVETLAAAMGVGIGWFVFGFALMILIPIVNFAMRIRLREWRGPYHSLETIPWYIHNGATYLLRYTFLEFVTPSPFSLLFYRAMGMKIGADCVLNTTHISDPQLIELGRRVTIGGSVTIVGHYGQGGYLVLAPVKIGDGATIGLRATVMGGAQIGDGAKVLPNSVVLPKTVIPAGETWGGVPARKFELLEDSRARRGARPAPKLRPAA